MYDGTREGVANQSWVRYRGDLNIYYSEVVTVTLNGGAATQMLTRTGVDLIAKPPIIRRRFFAGL
jgi:hypothetical protein